MTTEQINAAFVTYVEQNFPRYVVDTSFEDFYYLLPQTGDDDDSIEYNTTTHALNGMEWASQTTLDDIVSLEAYIQTLL